jgi:GT2 family glycosyltransferase
MNRWPEREEVFVRQLGLGNRNDWRPRRGVYKNRTMSTPKPRSLSRASRQLLISFLHYPPNLRHLGSKSYRLWRTAGWRGFKLQIQDRLREQRARTAYRDWVATYDTLKASDRRSIVAHAEALRYKPLISVVMPVYNVDEVWLRRAIESVRRQLYTHWELCIADDNSTKPHVRTVLEEYAARDPRIKVTFRRENGHISRASNSALELAGGEFVALLDHDDELSEHALYLVAEELNAHPNADLIYSDEDLLDENGRRSGPYFKPDWSPDLLRSLNMISHLGVFRTSVLKEVGGFRTGYEGSQDHDLALRVIERIPAANIRHIPHVLYHWRAIPGSAALGTSEKVYALTAAGHAIASHLARTGVEAEVRAASRGYHRVIYALPSPPLLSLIVAAPAEESVRETVISLLEQTDYSPLELLIIAPESLDAECRRVFEFDAGMRGIRTWATAPDGRPLNRAAQINAAMRQARGELACLVGERVRVIASDWLREMASHARRGEIGVVGAKLYSMNDTITHAGLILGAGGIAGSAHHGFLRARAGEIARTEVIQNFSAVSAACLVTRCAVFAEVGGLDADNLPDLYWDIDYCLRLRERGYRVLWTPYAELYQMRDGAPGRERVEPVGSRDNTQRKNSSPASEAGTDGEYIRARWGDVLLNDPHYNPNLNLERADYSVAIPPRYSKIWERELA